MNWQTSIAHLLQRAPFLYTLLLRLLQVTAARFSVGVTGVVYNAQGEVLLLQHVFRARCPWGLPGGWVGRRERPQDALRRELKEEVELSVQIQAPLVVDLAELSGHLDTGFLCETTGEIGRLSGEILAARWTSPEDLPDALHPLDREMIRRAEALRERQGPRRNGDRGWTDSGE